MHRFASALALGSLAIATFVSAPALADCVPGTGVCASAGATVGIPVPNVQMGGQVTVGIPVPTIVFPGQAPAPAPAVAPPQEPQVIVVRPYQPQPPVYVYNQPQPRPMYMYAPPQTYWGVGRLGVDLRVDGAAGFGGNKLGNAYGLGGAGLGLRYHATPHFGLEVGADVLGGRDYNDNKRLEIAGSLGGLLYFNPRSHAQLYLAAGMLADHATSTVDHSTMAPVGVTNLAAAGGADVSYTHLGGYGGLGLELFATRRLAFHLDVRGVVRQAVSSSDNQPEFTDAQGRSTNTSGGVVGSGGMIFYF